MSHCHCNRIDGYCGENGIGLGLGLAYFPTSTGCKSYRLTFESFRTVEKGDRLVFASDVVCADAAYGNIEMSGNKT